jgi:hypothetical protein
MASTNRKAPGTGAASVQSLTVPDWVREAMGSRSARPPPGALTVHELAKMMGMSRQHTNEIMKTMYDAGKIDRMSSGGKFHYFEKK